MTAQTTVHLADEAATCDIASRLATLTRAGDVLALFGDLGTGKSVFARAFIHASGLPDEEVPSPTFTLVQIYYPPRRPAIYHLDLYRLDTPDDARELGIDDAFAEGVSLIEWPERLGPLLPRERLDVCLTEAETANSRRLTLIGHGGWPARLREIAY